MCAGGALAKSLHAAVSKVLKRLCMYECAGRHICLAALCYSLLGKAGEAFFHEKINSIVNSSIKLLFIFFGGFIMLIRVSQETSLATDATSDLPVS